MPDVAFALVLNLHQPAYNLEDLLEHHEWEAKEILWAMDRIPRSLWAYEDVGRVHLSVSGTLLETLSSPGFQDRVYGIADCGSLLWYLQNTKIIQILGTGYYHPVLPLTPRDDCDEQLGRWQGIAQHLFSRTSFPGFWPPEMGFCMELIPALKRYGYRYVLVDSEHVEPVTPMGWDELRYRPHVARFGDDEIIVVVRDRELSDAQESGMDAGWFINEVSQRTKHCGFPPLVTTCTDGENGGWFRNSSAEANFWHVFYRDLLQRARDNQSGGIRPCFIDDYLDRNGTYGEVTVRPGAWNTGWHHGSGFTQWIGSPAQQEALTRVDEMSQAIHAARHEAIGTSVRDPEVYRLLEEAHWRVLRAETSCNFFWGEAWLQRCHDDLNQATHFLNEAGSRLALSRTRCRLKWRRSAAQLIVRAAQVFARGSASPRAPPTARRALGLSWGGLPGRLVAVGAGRPHLSLGVLAGRLGRLPCPGRVLPGIAGPGLRLGRPGLRAADRIVPLLPRRGRLLLPGPLGLGGPCPRGLGLLLGSGLRRQRLGPLRIGLPCGQACLLGLSLGPLAAAPEPEPWTAARTHSLAPARSSRRSWTDDLVTRFSSQFMASSRLS